MAKPIGNGKGGKSKSNERSQLVEDLTAYEGTDSNDFFYINPGTFAYDGNGDLPDIDGGGGADQIIMMEEAVILDGFFENMKNVTVLKFAEVVDDQQVDVEAVDVEEVVTYIGSEAYLGEYAQAAGIREVTGSSGDDVIDFSAYVIEYEYDEELAVDVAIPLEIIIKGGAGADTMTASAGNDTFLWKAGDMEGTDEVNFDTIIDFEIADDLLDISELGIYGWQALESDYDTLIQVATVWDYDANDGAGGATDYVNLVLLVGVDFGDFTPDVVIF